MKRVVSSVTGIASMFYKRPWEMWFCVGSNSKSITGHGIVVALQRGMKVSLL